MRASSSRICGGVVLAAVVDDDHFVIGRQRRGDLDGADHQTGNGAAIVVRRKKTLRPSALLVAIDAAIGLPAFMV